MGERKMMCGRRECGGTGKVTTWSSSPLSTVMRVEKSTVGTCGSSWSMPSFLSIKLLPSPKAPFHISAVWGTGSSIVLSTTPSSQTHSSALNFCGCCHFHWTLTWKQSLDTFYSWVLQIYVKVFHLQRVLFTGFKNRIQDKVEYDSSSISAIHSMDKKNWLIFSKHSQVTLPCAVWQFFYHIYIHKLSLQLTMASFGSHLVWTSHFHI